MFLDQKDFAGQPTVAPEIERMSLDPISLLKRGTHTTTTPATRQIAQVTPMQHSTASKGSRNNKGYTVSRTAGQGRTFAFEQNNNQVLTSQQQPQPRPAHSNSGLNRINRDMEPIDLTNCSPQPMYTNSNLPSASSSPNPFLDTVSRTQNTTDERMGNSRRHQTNRKRPRNQADSGSQVGRTTSQKKSQNGPLYQNSQVTDVCAPQQMNKPVTEMFRSWENSMSKYIDKPEDQSRWSKRAGHVVSTAVGKSLGLVSKTGRDGPTSTKFHAVNDSTSEMRSFALQPNRVAKVTTSKNVKPVDSASRQRSGEGTNKATSVARQGKKRSTTVPKNESVHSDNVSRKTPGKRNSTSDESKRAQLAREIYCPQYSDISNSQSIDENVSPRGVLDSRVETNFTSCLQAQHDRDSKRSISDINANSLHFSSNVDLARGEVGYDSVTGESDTSESGEDSSFVPPKKRKRYRKTSSDSPDVITTDKSNSSSRSGLSVIVNDVAESDTIHSRKTELKKALLLEKAAIEKKLSKISRKKGANGDSSDIASVQLKRFSNLQQGRIEASVYDFDSDISQSPKVKRKGNTIGRNSEQNGVAKIFAKKTPTKSKSRVPNNPGSGGSQRKRPNERSRTVAKQEETSLPRRTSPRKHASTARLSGSFENELWQNGVKMEPNEVTI